MMGQTLFFGFGTVEGAVLLCLLGSAILMSVFISNSRSKRDAKGADEDTQTPHLCMYCAYSRPNQVGFWICHNYFGPLYRQQVKKFQHCSQFLDFRAVRE